MYENLHKILNHNNRPNSKDYIDLIFSDFIELSGDRLAGDDPAIVCGIALIDNMPVTVVGQLRGRNIEENMNYNFSMMHPDGYRKALRLMKQSEKFRRPVVCFVDTIGAYPGVVAEQNNQASAISNMIMEMLYLKTPIITVLIGCGGSGGALALCVADKIAILEHATLSVISPKACAEILWKDSSKEYEAVEILKMTSDVLLEQKIVDNVISEPNDGAHSDPMLTSIRIKEYLIRELKLLKKTNGFYLIKRRQKKFRIMGEEVK